MKRFPNDMINLPNREYWLHPDRREETIEYLTNMLFILGIISSLFLITVFHFVYLFNTRQNFSPPILLAVVVFILSMIGTVVPMFIRFSKIPKIKDDTAM